MKLRLLFASFAVIFAAGMMTPDFAHAGDFKNLKVLKDNGKQLKKAMKNLTKGLGVKCKACHVKGSDYDKDDMPTKDKTRAFFKAAVGEADQGKKDAALKVLLTELKLDAAKKPEKLWEGIKMLEKK